MEISIWTICQKAHQVLTQLKKVLDDPSYVNVKHDFPMWTLKSYQVDCDENVTDSQSVKFYFNYKDECSVGTCVEACYYLNITNSGITDQCKKVCDSDLITSYSVLNDQRNVILASISHEVELRRPKLDTAAWPFKILSLKVDVKKSNHSADVNGPNSPFCFTD